MTQEDKNLLIKDLCTRLPYGVKFKHSKGFDTFEGIVDDLINPTNEHCYDVSAIKPYLFPLSSMTEEQENELIRQGLIINFKSNINIPDIVKDITAWNDWLYAHHFDVRGLIDKGLAIDATNLNIY